MHRVRTTMTLFAMLISGVAVAQTPPPEAAPPEAPPAPPPAEVAAPPAPEAPPPAPMAPPPPPAAAPKETFVPPAQPSMKIETPNKSVLKLGVLLQPQFQSSQPKFGAPASALTGFGNNFYIRRTRILAGGSLFGGVLEYFVDTDFPNLFLATNVTTTDAMGNMVTNSGVKGTPGMNIQDAFITFKPIGDVFKIDAGCMLPPLAHNAVQGATTLYILGLLLLHLPQRQRILNSSGNPIGRDAGMQFRGLMLANHLEYRLGLFQGLRAPQTATDTVARTSSASPGACRSTCWIRRPASSTRERTSGTKKVLSIGASFDLDDTASTTAYKYFAGDVLADLPLGPGVLTAQVNVAHWNGGTTFPRSDAEGDGHHGRGRLSYWRRRASARSSTRSSCSSTGPNNNEGYYGGGLAFWPYGHNTNLKAFYTYRKRGGPPSGGSQINVQWQLYFF